MGVSFPYPKMGVIKRDPGNGCLSCVNHYNCQALYWFRRYGECKIDEYFGIQCESWSNNPNDRVTTITQDDLDYVDNMFDEGIDSEACQNGITDPVTGSNRNRTW